MVSVSFVCRVVLVYNLYLTGVTNAENFELAPERAAVIKLARELEGTPSVKHRPEDPEFGTTLQTGFDCRGLVTYVLGQVGLPIGGFHDRNGLLVPITYARDFADRYGEVLHAPAVQPADLVAVSRIGFMPDHIGIVESVDLENRTVDMIHAPGFDGTFVERKTLGLDAPTPEPHLIPPGETRRYYEHIVCFRALIKGA